MRALGFALAAVVLAACGDDGPSPTPDAPDAPSSTVTTDHCTYEPVPATARAGGTVEAGPLTAGTADRVVDVPVGTALGGYTGRAGFLSSAGTVDARKIKMSGTFNPSIGVEAAPRVKGLALSAGGETVIILKLDAIFVYEGMLWDLEQRLGPEYAGKVLLATSHSHSAWAQFTGHGPLKLGSGQLRDIVYTRMLDTLEAVARDALAARQPAKLGVYATSTFDPSNQINRDRRPENDALQGGPRKDDHLRLLRVDATDGTPLAIVPIFGEHPVLNGEDNPFASADAIGGLERTLAEQFDRQVLVMHLQSAGADVSASGHGSLDCDNHPGNPGDPCFNWTAEEGHGRAAVTALMDAWTQAGTGMRDSIELEMLTRSVETGPRPETFTIRDGALAYAPFDLSRTPDGVVMNGATLASPIDEFNAPVGAALCETPEPMFPAAAIEGTEGTLPYGSCLRIDVAGEILGPIFNIDFGVDETHPSCEMTRTTVSALRLGDYVIGTLPGEVGTGIAELVREKSPVDADHTIVVGYAQGHVGYMLRPEDWVLGGYESSVTFWGPLEAEMLAERLAALMPLAMTSDREDGAAGGTTKVATAKIVDDLEKDEPAAMAGTVPVTVPNDVWSRVGHPAQAQPAAQIPRVAGIATFTWIGDDPQTKTPHVTLQHEVADAWEPVTRRSGRVVDDAELVLAYTPQPLQRSGPQTHFWVVEWQAVPWLGTPGLDALDDRGGVPLGSYRFHVEGHGWTLDSDPFEVVAGGVVLASPQRTGGDVRVTVDWFAPKGWRLMDMNLKSNQPVPVRSQPVTVELLAADDNVLATATPSTDANGVAQIADVATSAKVRVTDRFGNVATIALP
jgi:neutral ceramidase